MEKTFQAYVVDKAEGGLKAGFRTCKRKDLPAGDVDIQVVYSRVNFKDGLAPSPSEDRSRLVD
jgi:acrylyl-CoA reductase (NADPH)